MKTLVKTFIASALSAVVLVSSAFNASANEVPANHNTVIASFMDSYKTNDYRKMKSLLSTDATYKYTRQAAVVSHTAKDLLKFVKQNDGVTYQNCHLKSQILSETDAVVLAKISVNGGLPNASEQYITLENNGKGEWKITQIYQVYSTPLTKGVLAQTK